MTCEQTKSGKGFALAHNDLQALVIRKLMTERGFQIVDHTYHSQGFEHPDVKAVMRCDAPAALEIRGRADVLAMHPKYQALACYLEFKTNDGPHSNMAVELMPLVRHYRAWDDEDVDTLYVYRDHGHPMRAVDQTCTTIKGIWIDELRSAASAVLIPDTCPYIDTARKVAYKYLRCPVRVIGRTGGSNDPFVIVPLEALHGFQRPSQALDTWTAGYADTLGITTV